jgi:hypothetical protein
LFEIIVTDFASFFDDLGEVNYPLAADIKYRNTTAADPFSLRISAGEASLNGKRFTALWRYFLEEKDLKSANDLGLAALNMLFSADNGTEKDETATKTGINVTGTADLAPLDKQAAMVKEWVPNAKKVGILYCSAEKNSKYQATVVGAKLKEMGLEVKEYTAADSNEIASVTKLACQNSDVLYVPTDNTMASSAKTIDNIAQPAGVPIIAGEEGICSGCGIATLSISYYDIGYKAGEMAYDILVNGKDPATMDIEFVPEDKLTKEYDAARCKALGVKVVDGYKAIES